MLEESFLSTVSLQYSIIPSDSYDYTPSLVLCCIADISATYYITTILRFRIPHSSHLFLTNLPRILPGWQIFRY